jgi:hypothetical protein
MGKSNINKIRTNRYFPEKVSKSLQNKIIHQSQKLGCENNKLYYFPIKNNFNNKLEIPHPEDRSLIIADTHQLGHFGPQSTYEKIKSRYYWKRMFLMIFAFIQHCYPCQRHQKTRIYEHPALTLPIYSIFDRMGLNLVFGLPVTERGFKGILVMTEVLKK